MTRAEERRAAKRFGASLRAARRERGLTQDAVAAIIQTDAGSVSRIENGLRDPSVKQLRRLAPHLGLTAGQLLDAGCVAATFQPSHH